MNRFDAALYANKITKKKKQQMLMTELKKSVEHGSGGTLRYIIKKGPNKGKII